MQKIEKLNITELEKKVFGKSARAALICHLSNKVIKQVFEKDFLKEVKLISFKDGNLYFSATNTHYIQEIKIKEKEILDKTNELLGESIVKKIRFRPNNKLKN